MSTTPPSNDAVDISIIVPVHNVESHIEEPRHLLLEISRDVFTVIENYCNKSDIRLTTLILKSRLGLESISQYLQQLLVICLQIYIAMSQKKFEHETEFARLLIILLCLNYVIGKLAEDHFDTKLATIFIFVILTLLMARISPDIGRQAPESNS